MDLSPKRFTFSSLSRKPLVTPSNKGLQYSKCGKMKAFYSFAAVSMEIKFLMRLIAESLA